MDEGAWRTTVHGVTKSQTRLNRLSIHAHNLETNDTIITPRSEEAKGGWSWNLETQLAVRVLLLVQGFHQIEANPQEWSRKQRHPSLSLFLPSHLECSALFEPSWSQL